jgi:hypothetical protein
MNTLPRPLRTPAGGSNPRDLNLIQRKCAGLPVHTMQANRSHTMQPFRLHRRRLRQFAWVALFAWVSALAAGVANACVAAVPGSAPQGHETHRHTHVPGDDAQHHLASAMAVTHDITPHSVPEPLPDVGKQGCLKFCDGASSALSKNAGPDAASLAHVLLGSFKIQPIWVEVVNAQLPLERPSAQGPPLVIRLLRLTL